MRAWLGVITRRPLQTLDVRFAEIQNEFASSALERLVIHDLTAAQTGQVAVASTETPMASRPPPPVSLPTPTPAPVVRPLPPDVQPGCKVLVPRDLWPTYSCMEHGGIGWEATIVTVTASTAVVRFSFAKTRDHRPYEDERLPLSRLKAL